MACLSACFQRGRGSKRHKKHIKEKIDCMGKWSDPWLRSFLTLHDSSPFFIEGDAKIKSIVVL